MGTKVQATAFFPEYQSVIDLDGNTRNDVRSLYHDNQIVKGGQNPELATSHIPNNGYMGYDKEIVRQTMLKQESIFRSQVQELHRLYTRQRDLMNEMKTGANKDDRNDKNSQSISLFSSTRHEDANGTRNAPHSSSLTFLPPPNTTCKQLPSSVPTLGTISYDLGISADAYLSTIDKQIRERFSKYPGVKDTNRQTSYDRDSKSSASGVWTPQSNADPLKFGMYMKRNSYPSHLNIANTKDEGSESLMLGRGDLSMSSCSNSRFLSKDFLKNSLDGMGGESSVRSSGWTNERNGNKHLSADYSERRKVDDRSSIGDFCSGNSLIFSRPALAEARNEFPCSQKKKTIFGFEISEENESSRNSSSTIHKSGLINSDSFPSSLCKTGSISLNQTVRSNLESRRVSICEPFSQIANPLAQNLNLGPRNLDDGNHLIPKADEVLFQKGFSNQSKANEKWLQGCSSFGINLVEGSQQTAESDSLNFFKNWNVNSKPAEVPERDSEHSKKLLLHQSKLENPKSGLPWFLEKPQHNDEPSKTTESSYIMNVDSLQSFFWKSGVADGSFQNSKQRKDGEVGTNEVNNGNFKDSNPGEDFSKVNCSGSDNADMGKVSKNENDVRNQFETKKYSSNLKHHFDLNLSLDDEESLLAPSLPTAIAKISINDMDLETPAATKLKETSLQETNSREIGFTAGKAEMVYEERDRNAADAIIALSAGKRNWVNDGDRSPLEAEPSDPLNWFAEIVSSLSDVEFTSDQKGAYDEESLIPNGMDYFEFMTLQLEETKEEHYFYNPIAVSKSPIDEVAVDHTKSKKSRTRRGKQRKDFQRDILPGIVTLARQEMNEDLRTFKELSKSEGSSRDSSHRKNGKGKKRSGGESTSPPRKARCITQTEAYPICPQLELKEKSLTGWGKRRRRLPRQTFPNANLSFPVKC